MDNSGVSVVVVVVSVCSLCNKGPGKSPFTEIGFSSSRESEFPVPVNRNFQLQGLPYDLPHQLGASASWF